MTNQKRKASSDDEVHKTVNEDGQKVESNSQRKVELVRFHNQNCLAGRVSPVPFSMGIYYDEVFCNVIQMTVTYLLLGHPWLLDQSELESKSKRSP